MSKDIIYSCKQEITLSLDGWRITKFVDGEVESSYITTTDSCDCPAGVRSSCRHRQMLPQMIAAGIVNTQFFWDFDRGRAVDFNGQLKSNIDAMNELAANEEAGQRYDYDPDPAMAFADELASIPGITVHIMDVNDDPGLLHNLIAEAVGEPTLPAPKPFVRRL